jgi:uncharacterized protein
VLRSLVVLSLLAACHAPAAVAPVAKPAPKPLDPVVACAATDGETIEELFYPSGQLAARVACGAGKLDGAFASFYPNGSPRAVGNHDAGLRTGPWREWHANGHLWIEGAYAKGRETGHWVEYHATGLLKFEGDYQDGLLTGAWTSSCETGGIHATGMSVAGKLEGTITVRGCRDATQRTEQAFVHNQPNGVWRSFSGDRLTGDYGFKQGVVDGEVHTYDEHGKATVTARYADGMEIKEPAHAP